MLGLFSGHDGVMLMSFGDHVGVNGRMLMQMDGGKIISANVVRVLAVLTRGPFMCDSLYRLPY